MKFLFLTDTHWRADAPAGRTDNIIATQEQELNELWNIAQEEKADAVLHGGDVFNTKKPAHEMVTHILTWARVMKRPIYTVVGNHDVVGYNLASIDNSGLGVLFASGMFERLDTTVFEKAKLVIKGIHTSTNFQQDYVFGPEYDGYTKLIVSHNYVIPAETMPYGFIHPRDIPTNADLVLCGHYHTAYDVTFGKTRWINPGALSRWKINERNNVQQVLLIEAGGGIVDVRHRVLKRTKPGDDIFDIQTVEAQKQQEKNIDKFAKSINEQVAFKDVDVEDFVKEEAERQGLPEPVLKVVIAKVREAKEVLS